MEMTCRERSLNAASGNYFQHQDEDSLREVIESAQGLIRYYSRLYSGGCNADDIMQVGRLGLMKALHNYDKDKQTSFVTYASHAIIGEIRHYVRKEASFYRPGCIVELQSKVDKVIEDYVKQHGDTPTAAYIAQRLNIREESVKEVMKAGMVSFDEIDTAKIRSLTYESFRLPIEDKLILVQALKKLSAMQQKVIYMLFYHDMTQQQVAEKLGITQKQVSRVKERSVQMLRTDLTEKDISN